eukprot:15002984-Alexandrium_andersonii.AAC.1
MDEYITNGFITEGVDGHASHARVVVRDAPPSQPFPAPGRKQAIQRPLATKFRMVLGVKAVNGWGWTTVGFWDVGPNSNCTSFRQ